MPFTCDACGRRSAFTGLIPPVGDVLRCPPCAHERPFVRPPFLVVAGTCGIGKSTLCARLAGRIPAALLLDADILASDLVSVVSPNQDYPAFWGSMMRLAHELAQNRVAVVCFSTMLPEQVLSNRDLPGYFDSAHFLCLTSPPRVIRERLARRERHPLLPSLPSGVDVWIEFNHALGAAAREVPTPTVLDANRPIAEVAQDVRRWIESRQQDCGLARGATG